MRTCAIITATALAVPAAVASAQGQTVELESFSTGDFTNPFFTHSLEFDDPCCWSIANCEQLLGNFCELHLVPNTDFISLGLLPNQRVISVSVQMRDFEGGFVGDQPTSVLIARSRDDFVFRNVAEIATPEVLTIDIDTIGQLFGEPLGEIVELQLQAANEGNSVVPGIGAFYDDLTAVVETTTPGDVDFDGVVGITDLLELLAAWGPCPAPCPPACAGDVDGDCSAGINDLLVMLANWG